MAQFGEVRVDFITFTTGVSPSEGSVTIPVSGLVNTPSFSGDVTVTGNLTVGGTIYSQSNTVVSGVFTAETANLNNTTITGTFNTKSGVFSSGSASAPSITFTGDSDTGFFSADTNAISFTVSGTERWRISGDGSVYTYGSGAFQIPTGDTLSRPSAALTGMIRYNTSLARYEGYNAGVWASIGGGATGSGGDQVFVLNQQVVTTNYTLPSGNNATSCGPITINDGVEVIIGDDQNWAIV